MHKNKVIEQVWYYGLVWTSETVNLYVSSSPYTSGRTPLEYITVETPGISEHLDFIFYDWVTYRGNSGLGELSLGWWQGVFYKVGQAMSYWILPVSVIVL